MTLAVRNAIFRTGAFIAAAMLIAFTLIGYQLISGPDGLPDNEWPHRWLVWSWSVPPADLVASLVAIGIVGLLAVALLVVASRVFRRVSSAELYFFVLFVLSLSVEQLRLVQLYLLEVDVAPVYGMLLTRAVIVARIGGAFSLFASSLYALGIEYPRTGTLTLILGVLALVFVYLIPVDTVTIWATMLRPVAGQSGLELTLAAIGLMTMSNYIIAGARGHRDRGLLIGIAAVLVVAGTQVLWFVPVLPWLGAAVAAVCYGSVSFVLITRAHFLWY